MMQASAPGKAHNTARVQAGAARLGSNSAGVTDALEHYEACRSCQCPGSRSMAYPTRDVIIALHSALRRPWAGTMSGFGPPSIQDVDKLV